MRRESNEKIVEQFCTQKTKVRNLNQIYIIKIYVVGLRRSCF